MQEIVTHTLYENGVTSINKLESYVKNDIVRYGSKLRDIHSRLEITYKEALAVRLCNLFFSFRYLFIYNSHNFSFEILRAQKTMKQKRKPFLILRRHL